MDQGRRAVTLGTVLCQHHKGEYLLASWLVVSKPIIKIE